MQQIITTVDKIKIYARSIFLEFISLQYYTIFKPKKK